MDRNKAIGIIKSQCPANKQFVDALEFIIPELKESEDEKVRKELTEFLKKASEGDLDMKTPYETFGKWLALLEKQGTSYTKKDVDAAFVEGMVCAKNELEKQYNASYQIRKDIATFIFNYRGDIKDRAKWMNYLGIKVSFVEKQGDKPQSKSAIEAINDVPFDNDNKVEPKLKVGDWVVDNDCGKVKQVREINKKGYSFNNGDYSSFESAAKNYHLWTIKDAKDGDVLVYADKPFIYNGRFNSYSVGGYCGIHIDGSFVVEKYAQECNWSQNKDIKPATKEQRAALFQKMKEAGYEWDAEKKELVKLE